MRHAILMISLLGACQPAAAKPEPAPAAKPTPTSAAKPTTPTPPAKPAAVSEGEGHAEAARALLVGQPAPDATMQLLAGGSVELGKLIGKRPLYLKFWATWCKPCREQMPHLTAAYRKYGDRVGFYAVDLGLNDPIDDVRAFQAEQALPMPIGIDADGNMAERYHVVVTPLHVLIDRRGIVRYVGHEATPAVEAALEEIARDAPATAPAARPAAKPAAPLAPLALRDGTSFAVATGKPVALTFVDAWCDTYLAKTRPAVAEACAAHARQVAALQRSHPQLTWVIVVHPVWTKLEDLDRYVERLGVARRIGLDDNAAWFARYKVRDSATTILLDRAGKEVARIGGKGDELAAAVGRLR